MGFCSDEDVESFFKAVPLVERAIVGSGVILLKYWLEVSPEEQTRRLEARIHDGRDRSVVRGEFERQTPRAAQHHQRCAPQDSLRGDAPQESDASQAAKSGRL
jgi:hypothetical protein